MTNYFDLDSDIYKNSNTLSQKFEIFANYLLNTCILNINHEKYFIEEIEFYYFTNTHADLYVHQMKKQKTSNDWYFHSYKNGTYKSGTYKGIDLTFGNDNAYGGILIRAIQHAETSEYIIGPCNVVNHILEKLKFDSVEKLASSIKFSNAFSKHNPFYLSESNPKITYRLFKGPRVGLSAKYPEYMFANYRFLKNPRVTLKYKDTLVSVLYSNGSTLEEIHDLTKIPKSTIAKFISTYENGKKMSDIPNGKNINEMFGFYTKNQN